MNKDVCIVGGGIAGLSTALFVSNRDITLFEEHPEVGYPEHCSGLIGHHVSAFVEKISPKLIDARYSRVSASIGKLFFHIEFKRPSVFHVNRPELEARILDTISSRVSFQGGVRVKPGVNPFELKAGGKTYNCATIVASDGPLSIFRRKYFLSQIDIMVGIQGLFRVSNLDPDNILVIYPGILGNYFSWIIPLDYDTALIGGLFRGRPPPIDLIAKHASIIGVSVGSRLKIFGGPVPMGPRIRDPVFAGKIFLFGDALPLTKPYTGGGLYHIVRLVPILGKALDNNDPTLFRNAYRETCIKLSVEDSAVRIFRNKHWIPLLLASCYSKTGFITPIDYDKHYELALKLVATTPFIWPILPTLQISRKR